MESFEQAVEKERLKELIPLFKQGKLGGTNLMFKNFKTKIEDRNSYKGVSFTIFAKN